MGETTESREVSRILKSAAAGGEVDFQTLLPMVYDHLRRIARKQMATERDDHTLDTSALVHETYLKLVGNEPLAWNSKSHFYAAAAQAMRRILVDHARARASKKRGGHRHRVALDLAQLVAQNDPAEFLAVDEAISRLEGVDARAGEIVRLRLFAGLGVAETAQAMNLTRRTVERDWAYARAYLHERLK